MKYFVLFALIGVSFAAPLSPAAIGHGALISRTIASDHVVHPAIGVPGLGLGGLGGYYGGLMGYPQTLGLQQAITTHSVAHVPHVGLGGLYKNFYGGYFPGSFGIGYGQFGPLIH